MTFGVLLALVLVLPSSGLSQARTWTFCEDGIMQGDSGRVWSFKKNGRIDAAFVRLSGTNVILLSPDAKYRKIPVICLSDSDRSFLDQVNDVSNRNAARITQAAAAQNAATRRIEAARLRNEAAANRQLAQLSLEAAGKLENEAAELTRRAGGSAVSTNSFEPADNTLAAARGASPPEIEIAAAVKAEGEAGSPEADGPLQSSLKARHQAADRRAAAARLEKEADSLEQMANSLEPNTVSRAPTSH
jgi:hypothetical protein